MTNCVVRTWTELGYHTRSDTVAVKLPEDADTFVLAAPRVWLEARVTVHPWAAVVAVVTSGSVDVHAPAGSVREASTGEARGVPYTPITVRLALTELPVRGAVFTSSDANALMNAYTPTRAGVITISWPDVRHPTRESAKLSTPLERNVIVPWFTRDATVPDITDEARPAGADDTTVKVRVSMADTRPVTAELAVVPLMPVAAALTVPAVAEFTDGVLNRGADAEPATYDSTAVSYVTEILHDVSTLVPLKASMDTEIVSPAYLGLWGNHA